VCDNQCIVTGGDYRTGTLTVIWIINNRQNPLRNTNKKINKISLHIKKISSRINRALGDMSNLLLDKFDMATNVRLLSHNL